MMNNINKISTSEQRHRMIETAAYYRAEKRGFSDGDPLKDWIEAEREIDVLFQRPDDADYPHYKHNCVFYKLVADIKQSFYHLMKLVPE